MGGTASGRQRALERTAVASRHRDTVPAIFDDGGSFLQIEIAVRPTQCPLCPIATNFRIAAK
jgi:hypothetical protein